MTIAVSLKVQEGLVLAADSASTLMARLPNGENTVINVYNHANKIFNLVKGLPIGVMTWGVGGIGSVSVGTLIKDLRVRLTEDGPEQLDSDHYEIAEVARRVKEFIFDEHYGHAFQDWPTKPDLGFIVGGYSSGAIMAEEYRVDVVNGVCSDPTLMRPLDASGVTWNGQIEAISRLMLGYSAQLPGVLLTSGLLTQDQIDQLLPILGPALNPGLVQDAMPLQDAIDLAVFLVDVAIRASQFAPGAQVVGGPIEVAVISKHESFKWVQRKHYYNAELNPPIQESGEQ